MTPTLSIVIPVFNEQAALPDLVSRLEQNVTWLQEPSEIIFIDDGSSDRTLNLIKEIRSSNIMPWISYEYVSFSRNFGHQAAIIAGLEAARGEAIVIMDADGQDPPELLPELVEAWRRGSKVVNCVRTNKPKATAKSLLAWTYYRLLQMASDTKIPLDCGDFCLMDRQVVDVINSLPERNRYLRGLRCWVGFQQSELLYDRPERTAGQAKYTFAQSTKLGIVGLVSFSNALVYVPLLFGTAMCALAFLLSAVGVWEWKLGLIGSFFLQAAIASFTNLYVASIHNESKGRPSYIIAESSIGSKSEQLSTSRQQNKVLIKA